MRDTKRHLYDLLYLASVSSFPAIFRRADLWDSSTIANRRQMFTESSVGEYKCAWLAKCFNLAMGLGITWYAEPLDAERHCQRYGTLLLGCVDNHLARITLSNARNAIWIDAGNARTSLQVCIGDTDDSQTVRRGMQPDGSYRHLPNAALLFPELLEPEPQPALVPTTSASCADLVAMSEQSLLVNDMAGIVAAEYVYKLLNRLPIRTFLTYVDTDLLTMRSVAISLDTIKERLKGR